MAIAQRVTCLRSLMDKYGIDYYLVPSTDQHNNEYVPECWQRRPWISDFDGSAGEVLVGMDCGFLWTDGRYFLQAEQQLDPEFFVLKKQTGFASELETWLIGNIRGKTLGVDPRVISIHRAEKLIRLVQKHQGKVQFLETNLVDEAKAQLEGVPELPSEPVMLQPNDFAGCDTKQKISRLQNELVSHHVNAIILTALDEIAWLYNIRGQDIDFNPLAISYAIVTTEQAYLYIDDQKLSNDIQELLVSQNIQTQPYDAFADSVKQLSGSVWIDANVANYWIKTLLNTKAYHFNQRSPVLWWKACKNNTEIKGAVEAHKIDAVAVMKLICWLENNWQKGVDELEVINQLHKFRSNSDLFRGNSFDTIAGFAANGAIIHYRSSPATSKVIDDGSLFLLDSGGQYPMGTTDITRTLHLGEPTSKQKRHYTLVLKGHLQLRNAVFPDGIKGEQLDVLARLAIWKDNANYKHGTGHGVGSFLCVHEGPQKISQAPSGVPLQPGMIVSNEPGLYLENQYGIRIENLIYVQQHCQVENSPTGDGPFYTFEDLTLVPYERKLIDKSLLTGEEVDWVNQYHEKVWLMISPLVGSETLRQWLKDKTARI